MKLTKRKLSVRHQVIRALTAAELAPARGGEQEVYSNPTVSCDSCSCPCPRG